jgi:hypothetical protein
MRRILRLPEDAASCSNTISPRTRLLRTSSWSNEILGGTPAGQKLRQIADRYQALDDAPQGRVNEQVVATAETPPQCSGAEEPEMPLFLIERQFAELVPTDPETAATVRAGQR